MTVMTTSPDNRLMAAGYDDGTISVWEQADGKLLASWQAHSDTGGSADSAGVWGLTFSTDGKVLQSHGLVKVGDQHPESDLFWNPLDGQPAPAAT